MNKFILRAALAAAVIAAPALSFAQSNVTVTRAQVNAQLVQLEKAGYSPFANATDYPADIQAAEAKVSMGEAQTRDVSGMNSSGGMPLDGRSASGKGHHAMQQGCVGPVDYCTPFFGS